MSDDEDQGFTCETKTQFIELSYIPYYPSSHQPPLPNNLKISSSAHSQLSSALLNPKLIAEAARAFMQQHGNSIIYNNVTRKTTRHQSDIQFQSNFQSGNLEYVIETGRHEYELYMRADSNTRGHYQWFYFRMKNKQVRKVTLIIKNFIKSSLLYRKGLKPYAKSAKNKDAYYEQIGSSVVFKEEGNEDEHLSYSIKFQYVFQHLHDEVEFCNQPPYTYTRLGQNIEGLGFKSIEMGRTILGHPIRAFVIGDLSNCKGVCVAIARQHPGETVGSWLMEGFIKKLQSANSSYSWLVVPMVNIDGVMLGNNRTGLLGYDFNRNWNADEDSVRSHIFPQLTGILKYFKKCRREKSKKIKLFLDMHGHSSQPNVFTYGPPFSKQSEYYENSRLFPYLMSKRNQSFKLAQCSYEIEASKKNCARAIFHQKLGFPYSYTVESSFGIYNDRPINQCDMVKVGEDLCDTAIQFMSLLAVEKNEEKFEKLIHDMKIENEKYSDCLLQEYQSDSGGDQKEECDREELEMKVTSLFKQKSKVPAPTLTHQSTVEPLHLRNPKRSTPKDKSKASWHYSSNLSEAQMNLKDQKSKKGRSYHLKTEPFSNKLQKPSVRRQLKLPNLNKQRVAYGNIITRRTALMNSMKKVKLQQLQSIHYNGNSCTIGKEIVIFNGYRKYEKTQD